MSNKKKVKRKRTKSELPADQPHMGHGAMEKMMSDIGRLFEQEGADSVEKMNAVMKKIQAEDVLAMLPEDATPLRQAQELIYEAWEQPTAEKAVELARLALDISADCADAYSILAEETAKDMIEMKKLYEQGLGAAERALGPEVFETGVGHFWGMLETRPYMRARLGLAQCLWELGERQSAIDHCTEMIRLNPNDNQGVRYLLVCWLLREGRNDDAGRLLDQYDGDIATEWSYNRALLLFRKSGASSDANGWLEKAVGQNSFVPPYLLGKKKIPKELPEHIGVGDENEAVTYAAIAFDLWRETPGALEWLA